MKLRRGSWIWFAKDPSVLDPWVNDSALFAGSAVKRNAVRSVFRVDDSSGHGYFVKMERKTSLFSLLRNRFFSKAESEFHSGNLLLRCGIPCAEYVAWGYHPHGGSVIVSRALDGYVSAMKDWYSRARFDEKLREKWLDLFFNLTLQFQKNSLIHPDFHSGNVMIHPDHFDFSLIDAYGIRRRDLSGEDAALRANLAWLLPLRMDIPEEQLIAGIGQSGLFKGNAELFFRSMLRRNELFLERDWKKRRVKQILSGNSKFSHREGNREIRHTLWYEPSDLPPESELVPEEMPEQDAEACWLESFRNQLFCKKSQKIPLIFERNGKKSRIFNDLCKKNSYFY